VDLQVCENRVPKIFYFGVCCEVLLECAKLKYEKRNTSAKKKDNTTKIDREKNMNNHIIVLTNVEHVSSQRHHMKYFGCQKTLSSILDILVKEQIIELPPRREDHFSNNVLEGYRFGNSVIINKIKAYNRKM